MLKPSAQTKAGDRTNLADVLVYEVQEGDNLFTIAKKFSLKIETIAQNNEIINVNRLKPGMKLTILPVDGVLHKTGAKDTIKTIASKYGVKKEDIIAQNNLGTENKLTAGKNLIIPGGKKWTPRYIASRSGDDLRFSGAIADIKYQGKLSKGIIKPTAGVYTQYFRWGHYAVDIANAKAGPIYAVANGKVVKAQCGWNGGYGCMVILDHGNELKTLYAHNAKNYVKVGDTVDQGQTIAWMGNTGRVRGRNGIHVHFEVISKGIKRNPLAYFN